jgi:FG-GAP repeat
MFTQLSKHGLQLATVLLIICAILPATAQDFAPTQTLRAPPSGEGEPSGRFGSRVALESGFAVVADFGRTRGTVLRAYQRNDPVSDQLPALTRTVVNGGNPVWDRLPGLTRTVDDGGRLLDMALSGNRLVYSRSVGNVNKIEILDRVAGAWVQSRLLITPVGSTLGRSVAVDGNIVVIGEPATATTRGRVTVLRLVSGNWLTDTLTPSVGQNGASFGKSVAIVQGAVVVGAPGEDATSPVVVDAGAAYVFELTGSVWSQVSRLTAATPIVDGNFGEAVGVGESAVAPDKILIGEPGTNARTVSVYRRTGPTASPWALSFALSEPNGQAGSQFGSAISIAGNRAMIGAPGFDAPGTADAGAVYGVEIGSTLASTTIARRTDPQPLAGAAMGFALAQDSNGSALIGVPRATSNNNLQQGVVLFSASPAFLPVSRAIDLGQGLENAYFGFAMSADADTLLVGAPFESVGGEISKGAAYLYRRVGAGPYQFEQRFLAPDGGANDGFGYAVAIKGDSLLIGAPFKDSTTINTGRAYAYRRSGGSWNLEQVIFGNCASATRRNFGIGIAFNGSRALISGVCSVTPPAIGLDLGTAVYARNADGTWTASTIVDAARMGGGAWDGDIAVVGTPVSSGADDNFRTGSVCSHQQDPSTLIWSLNGACIAGPANPIGGFGWNISINSGLMAVASHANSTPVSIYRRNGASFLPEATLLPAGLGANDAVRAVQVADGRLAMGVSVFTSSLANQGAVMTAERVNGIWTERQRVLSPNPQNGGGFGYAMAMPNGEALIVGAPFESSAFLVEGAVYILATPPNIVFRDGFE